eukprot:GFUD01033941.1.p1 GENE.GFUD01033941.1~~GFUD01033941.1.p1  ORF type:complete len:1687 (-),score=433.49 GFUD01033941.1:23-5083(-)
MGDIAVYGPIQDSIYLCRLTGELTVPGPEISTVWKGEGFFTPGQPVTSSFVPSSKDGVFLLQTLPRAENSNEGKPLSLRINGMEMKIEPSMDKNALFGLEEMFEMTENPEGKIKIQDMIDEVEFKITQDLQKRAQLLTDTRTSERNKRRADVEELRVEELRKLGSSKADKGLHHRFMNHIKETNYKEMDIEDVRTIEKAINGVQDKQQMPECFVLHTSSLEATKISANEFLKKGSCNVTSIDYLKQFGLNGIPIVHVVDNYTDPMNIGINNGVKEVANARSFCLNQSSLWNAKSLNQVKSLSLHSGVENDFTAVVPIKSWNNIELWTAFRKNPLGKMGISAHLRGTANPLPNDQSALTCATLMQTIKLWDDPKECEAEVMADLLDTIQFHTGTRQSTMSTADRKMMGIVGSADELLINEMASELAPIANIMGSKEVLKFAGSTNSKEMWRAVVSNSIYWTVRRSVQGKKTRKWKQQTIKNLFNTHTKTVNKAVLNAFEIDTALYAKTFSIAKKFSSSGDINTDLFKNISSDTAAFEDHVAVYDFQLFKAVEVVKALMCQKSTWRWTKKDKYPYLKDKNAAWEWLENITNKSCQKEEEKEKREDEEDEKIMDFVNICSKLSFQDFCTKLNDVIPDEFNKFRKKEEKPKFCIDEVRENISREGTVDVKQKLFLILFGRTSSCEWNRGEFLRNDEIAERILKKLISIVDEKDLEDMSINLQWLTDMEKALEDKFAKHWYRSKGSRRKYSNQKPSFWAITGYTHPWSFLLKDEHGYEKFKVRLQSFDNHGQLNQQSFYDSWSHLLKIDPTKDNTTGRKAIDKRESAKERIKPKFQRMHSKSVSEGLKTKSDLLEMLNQKFLSIYPYPTDFGNGFDILMRCLKMSSQDYNDKEFMVKVTTNWKNIAKVLLNEEDTKDLIHSIQEIFALNETSSMAFTAFNYIGKNLLGTEISKEKEERLKALLNQVSEEACSDTIEDAHVFNAKGKIEDEEYVIFEKDHQEFLEELLPMRYIELQKAIKFLYEKDHTKKMALTLHILKRYADMKFTSDQEFRALIEKKMKKESTDGAKEAHEEAFKYTEPSVDFELIFDIQDKNEETVKESVNKIILDIQTKENLILWLNQAYQRDHKKNLWKPLKRRITKDELKQVSVAVTEGWYGNFLHQMIHINFNYGGRFENEDSISNEERERLKELKNFFHLALEYSYQILPAVGAFNLNGSTYQVKKDMPTQEERAKKVVLTIQELWKGFETDEKMRDKAASIFKTLGDLGLPYNRSEQIFELLKSVRINEDGQEVRIFNDNDRLEIIVEEAGLASVRTINCNPVLVWPEKERRLKDMPENEVVGKIKNIFVEELIKRRTGLFDNIYDALVHEALLGGLMKDKDIFQLLEKMRTFRDEPRTRMKMIIEAYSDNNGTLGGLEKGITKLSEDYRSQFPELHDAASKISNDINSLISVVYEQFRNERSFHDVITTMDKFIDFLKKSKGSAVQHHPSITKLQLYERIGRNDLKPGDMIWMWRKKPTFNYAHAGIYVATNTKKFLIHVQPRRSVIINKGGKVVCEPLDVAVQKNDKIFVVRSFKKRSEQEQILRNAFACVSPEKLKFKYNAYHGSCQTFCSNICGIQTLTEMNPEMQFTDANWFKRTVATRVVGNSSTPLNLVNMLQERLRPVSRFGCYDNEALIDVCNDPSIIPEEFLD